MRKSKAAVALVIAAMAAAFYVYRQKVAGPQVDGVALNNPGLIRVDPNLQLLGEIRPSAVEGFVQFIGPVPGLYAIARKLRDYGEGTRTLREFITAWATFKGASAAPYVQAVSEAAGIAADARPVGLGADILRAVVLRETGQSPYTPLQYRAAMNMLLVGWP